MRTRFAPLVAATLLVTPVATRAQTTINFDGTSAPCLISRSSPLTTRYAAQGVTFSGGGTIVNQCGGFGFNARSGTDFLAFNRASDATGPEDLIFSSAVQSVSIFAATRTVGATFFLSAFDAAGGLLGTTSIVPVANTFTSLAFSGTNIRTVRLISTADSYAYDDLSFTESGVVPEPGTWALLGTGLIGLGGVAARRRRLVQV